MVTLLGKLIVHCPGKTGLVKLNDNGKEFLKKRKAVDAKVDKNKVYSLEEASSIVKTVNTTKFDASVDIHIRLGVDPKRRRRAARRHGALARHPRRQAARNARIRC